MHLSPFFKPVHACAWPDYGVPRETTISRSFFSVCSTKAYWAMLVNAVDAARIEFPLIFSDAISRPMTSLVRL